MRTLVQMMLRIDTRLWLLHCTILLWSTSILSNTQLLLWLTKRLVTFHTQSLVASIPSLRRWIKFLLMQQRKLIVFLKSKANVKYLQSMVLRQSWTTIKIIKSQLIVNLLVCSNQAWVLKTKCNQFKLMLTWQKLRLQQESSQEQIGHPSEADTEV